MHEQQQEACSWFEPSSFYSSNHVNLGRGCPIALLIRALSPKTPTLRSRTPARSITHHAHHSYSSEHKINHVSAYHAKWTLCLP